MALYFNLPVYKVSYKLVFLLFQTSSSFSREYKYTIGQDLKNEGMDLIKNIYRANKVEDKTIYISKAKENLETVRLLVRLMQDFNQLGIKPFVEINQGIENVSKQLNAWGKYSAVKLLEVKAKDKNVPELSIARA
ncbi:MAG: four helix bundle protein [bacterium]